MKCTYCEYDSVIEPVCDHIIHPVMKAVLAQPTCFSCRNYLESSYLLGRIGLKHIEYLGGKNNYKTLKDDES